MMTSQRVVVRTCDRCQFGRDVDATVTRSFAIDDQHYEIDLCDKHAEMLDRDLGLWSRLATEVDSPKPTRSAYFAAERKREAEKLATVLSETRRATAHERFLARRQAEQEAEAARVKAEAEAREQQREQAMANLDRVWRQASLDGDLVAASDAEVGIHQLIPQSSGWHFTVHGRQQAIKRELSLPDIYETLANPNRRVPQSTEAGEGFVYNRGCVHVVGDPRTKSIITAFRREPTQIQPTHRKVNK